MFHTYNHHVYQINMYGTTGHANISNVANEPPESAFQSEEQGGGYSMQTLDTKRIKINLWMALMSWGPAVIFEIIPK